MFGLSQKEIADLLSNRPIPPKYWRRTTFELIFLVVVQLALVAWAVYDYIYSKQNEFGKYTDLFRFAIAVYAAMYVARGVERNWRRYKEALYENKNKTSTRT